MHPEPFPKPSNAIWGPPILHDQIRPRLGVGSSAFPERPVTNLPLKLRALAFAMCGITGYFNFSNEPTHAGVIGRMVATLSHRGPDETGVHTEDGVALGHARLSIIDLATGQQPMCNDDGSLWICFNGEIFNYIELRRQLEAEGVRFRTKSDTEVLLRLYEARGETCLNELNGQWAFAIWDRKRRRLFLARDRAGVRPVYYAQRGDTFVFGSEVKSIFAHPCVERAIDAIGLDQLFTFWSPLAPRTVFKGVSELPAGHAMVVENGHARSWCYWQPSYEESDEFATANDCAEQLLELLVDATRLRLRSDVPVGAYLSGGLDSTVITAIIKHYTTTPLKTFSVTFDDGEFDESAFQNDAVRLLQTDHATVRATYDDIGAAFPKVVWHAERPMIRTAPTPLYLLAGLVRQHGYKVVLTGEGADEMLGGYDIFKEAKIRRFWGRNVDSTWRPLLLKRLYPYLQSLQSQSPAYLQSFFHVRPQDLDDPFFSHLPRWEVTQKLKVFFSHDVKHAINGYNALDELRRSLPSQYGQWNSFCQAQYLETTGLLPGYLLSTQGDRMAMGHSVEGRFPFLDYRVMEFAARIPARWKMRVLDEKYILKLAAGHLVPESIRKRRKQPYRAPDVTSFFDTAARRHRFDYVREALSETRIEQAGLFNPSAVSKLVSKSEKGQTIGIKDNMALVGVLSTQLLVEQFIQGTQGRAQYAGD